MLHNIPSAEQVAEAVQAYNSRFGVEDQRMWALAKDIIQEFQSSASAPSLEKFVWAVKTWGRVQGVWSSDKSAMARALVDLNIPFTTNGHEVADIDQEICVELWVNLVTLAQRYGVRFRHFSWASKILHWLFPRQVPIYDTFVRRYLGIPNREGELAYRTIVTWEYAVAHKLAPIGDQIVGEMEPRTLLRAIDKFLWWESGGKNSRTWVISTSSYG